MVTPDNSMYFCLDTKIRSKPSNSISSGDCCIYHVLSCDSRKQMIIKMRIDLSSEHLKHFLKDFVNHSFYT